MKKKYDITKLDEIRTSQQGQMEDLYSQFIEMVLLLLVLGI